MTAHMSSAERRGTVQHVPQGEELPAAVTVVCPVCGRGVTSRQSGNTTRCPVARGGCGTAFTVPAGSTRPPVPLLCRKCGHGWDSRAKSGSTVRCPSCSHPRRVPSGSRSITPPSAAPVRYAPAPPPRAGRTVTPPPPEPRGFLARLGALFRVPDDWEPTPETVALNCYRCGHEWDSTAAPGNTIRCPECKHPRRVPAGTAPAPAATRPTPTARPALRPVPPSPTRAATPTPSRPAAPAPAPLSSPADAVREERRMQSVGMAFRSLGGPWFVYYGTPAGICESMNVNELPPAQQCTARATHAVRVWHDMYGETYARACQSHAEAMAKHLRRFDGFRADTQRLLRPV